MVGNKGFKIMENKKVMTMIFLTDADQLTLE